MPENYKQFVFDIQGFLPPEKPDLGRWGFEIILDSEVAMRARNKSARKTLVIKTRIATKLNH